ncbi:MAG: hypothetical protein OXF20_10720 [Gammaproteobacteria bacterium]|nr:hypothetical protein [Gammaproteobacteria bacterium]
MGCQETWECLHLPLEQEFRYQAQSRQHWPDERSAVHRVGSLGALTVLLKAGNRVHRDPFEASEASSEHQVGDQSPGELRPGRVRAHDADGFARAVVLSVLRPASSG